MEKERQRQGEGCQSVTVQSAESGRVMGEELESKSQCGKDEWNKKDYSHTHSWVRTVYSRRYRLGE